MTVKINDLLNYKYLSSLKLSADGRRAAFIERTSNAKKDGYDSLLNVINSRNGEIIKILDSFQSDSFSWMDEDSIVVGIKENNETKFLKCTLNGQMENYFTVPFNAMIEDITKDGQLIISSNRPINEEKAQEKSEYRVLDEYPFWYDGRGFISKIRKQLFLCKKGEEYKLISPVNMDVDTCRYDIESNSIAYFGSIIEKIKPDTSSVFIYDIQKSTNKKLIDHGQYRVKQIDVLNDSVVIVATKADESHFKFPILIRINTVTSEQNVISAPNKSINNTIIADCRMGSGTLFKCSKNKLYFIVTEDYCSQLYIITKEGSINKISFGEGSVDMFDVVDDTILFVGMRNMQLQEVFRIENEIEIQLTSINNNRIFLKPVECKVLNSEGFDVCGLVLKPERKVDKDKFPLVLLIHGGPNVAFGLVFHHEMQSLVNEGYYVACVNPSGSDGKGDVFGDISGRWGTIDYEDIMKFTDELLIDFPEIDEERMAVFGGSYGGYMTNWIIGHTNRFKTAISDRGISNCISKDVTGDNAIRFGEMHMKANVYDNPEYMWDRSPLKYAPNVKTPTLFIHGIDDHRCHCSESIMMYTAIRSFGVESRMALFKGETHELCRSGKPKNRIRRLHEVVCWLEKHL